MYLCTFCSSPGPDASVRLKSVPPSQHIQSVAYGKYGKYENYYLAQFTATLPLKFNLPLRTKALTGLFQSDTKKFIAYFTMLYYLIILLSTSTQRLERCSNLSYLRLRSIALRDYHYA